MMSDRFMSKAEAATPRPVTDFIPTLNATMQAWSHLKARGAEANGKTIVDILYDAQKIAATNGHSGNVSYDNVFDAATKGHGLPGMVVTHDLRSK